MKIRLYEILLILINIIVWFIIINNYNEIKKSFLKHNGEIFGLYIIGFTLICINILILCNFSNNVSNLLNKFGNFILKILKTEFKI